MANVARESGRWLGRLWPRAGLIPAWGPFSANDLLQTDAVTPGGARGGIRGVDGAWWAGLVWRQQVAPTIVEYLVECGSTVLSGYNLRIIGATSVTFRTIDGAVGTVAVSSNATYGGDPGWHAAIFGRDASGHIFLSANNDTIQTASIVGYTAPDPADPMRIGARNNGLSPTITGRPAAFGGSDATAPDAAAVAAWFSAVKAAILAGSAWGDYDPDETDLLWVAHSLSERHGHNAPPDDQDLIELGSVPRVWLPRAPIHW